MGTPAYLAIIKTTGTSTAMVDALCILLYPWVYRIADPVKRVLDRKVIPVIKKNDVVVSAANYTIDYLLGTITFLADPSGDISVSGNYMPVSEVAGAHSYQLNIGGDVLDSTNFKDSRLTGYRSRDYGMLDVSVSFERHSDLEDLFVNKRIQREEVLIYIHPGGGLAGYVGWFVIEKDSMTGEITGLEEDSISFNLDGDSNASFSYFEPILWGLSIFAFPGWEGNGDYFRMGLVDGRPSFLSGEDETTLLRWVSGGDSHWSFTGLVPIYNSLNPDGILPYDVAMWQPNSGSDPNVHMIITPIYA